MHPKICSKSYPEIIEKLSKEIYKTQKNEGNGRPHYSSILADIYGVSIHQVLTDVNNTIENIKAIEGTDIKVVG